MKKSMRTSILRFLFTVGTVSLTCDRAQGDDRKQFSIPMTLPFPNMYGMVM